MEDTAEEDTEDGEAEEDVSSFFHSSPCRPLHNSHSSNSIMFLRSFCRRIHCPMFILSDGGRGGWGGYGGRGYGGWGGHHHHGGYGGWGK